MKIIIKLLIASAITLLGFAVKAETVTYYVNDATGSPIAAMNSAGTVIWRESYNPFGEGRIKPSQNGSDIGFTGHQKDDSTGLTYMQARYYDPIVGRFYGYDPVGYTERNPVMSFNRFAYANNNPYKFVDPDGRNPLAAAEVGWFIGGGINVVIYHIAGITLSTMIVDAVWDAVHNESSDDSGDGERELGELETIHDPDHPENDPDIGELSDEDLGEAINNPENGEKVKVKGVKVMDGNTRVNEAKKRGWPSDTKIPVEELPNPTVDPDDPLGGYER